MPSNRTFHRGYQRVVEVCTSVAGALCLWTLVANLFGAKDLAALGGRFKPLSLLAGMLLLLLSVALWLVRRGPGRLVRIPALLFAGAAAAVATCTLVAYALFSAPVVEAWFAGGRWPMRRFGVLAAAATLALALAVLAGPAFPRARWRWRQLSALLAMGPLGLGLMVLVSYIAGAPLLLPSSSLTMSLPAALECVLLGTAALMTAGADTWPLALFATPNQGESARTPAWFPWGSLLLFLVLAAGILVGGGIVLRVQLKAGQRAVHKELATTTNLKADQIAAWYQERLRDAEHLFLSSLVQGRLKAFLGGTTAPADRRELQEYLDGFCRSDGYRQIVLYGSQGEVQLLAHPKGTDAALLPTLARVQVNLVARRVKVVDLHQGAPEDPLHLSLWIPVGLPAHGPDSPMGVLVLRVDAREFLFPLLATWPNPSPSAESLLVRRQGNEAVYVSELRSRPQAPLALRVALDPNGADPALPALLGREGLTHGLDYRGQPVVAEVQKVPGAPWFLLCKVDEGELYGPLWQQSWITGAVLLGLVGLVALVLGLGVRQGDARRILGQLAFERERKRLALRFEQLMRQASDMILLTDSAGRILEANEAACTHFGYGLEEFRALELDQLAGLGGRPEFQRRFQALKVEGSAHYEAVHGRRDGSEFIAEITARVVDLGDETSMLFFARDISRRKENESALRESERFLREAQEAGRVGTYTWDIQKDDWKASATLEEIFGIGPGHPRNLAGWMGLIPPAVREEKGPALLDQVQNQGRVDIEYPILRPVDGLERWVHGKGTVELDGAGQPLRLVGVIQDITERKAAESARRALEAHLNQVQKLESLGSLAGGVAHDMNNVLGAVLSLASSHREHLDGGDPLATSFDTIINACLRGRGVVKSLLCFSRKELEETRMVDLNGVVRDLVQLLAYTTLKRVDLRVELEEPLRPLEGDAGALSHALMNVCVNAVDAMPGGGMLLLRTENLADGRVRLTAQDTGEGMPPEVRGKALEPFFTTKPMGKGTGLGLAMAFGTVKAHGGVLELFSEVGKGTEVQFTFPAVQEPLPTSAGGLGGAGSAAAIPLSVLLVDDDELIRDSVGPLLQMMGHSLALAEGGQQALDLLEGGLEVDLVILDMNMPGLNGAQTLPLLRAHRPHQAVLLASGYNDADINALIGDHGNLFSIQKPFTLGELQRKIAEMALTPAALA